MSIFKNMLKKNKQVTPVVDETGKEYSAEACNYQPLPAYIEASPEEYSLVSLIAASVAAEDRPDSQFVVKKIFQRNPEAKEVSLLAASLATGMNEDSQFIVRKIAKKK